MTEREEQLEDAIREALQWIDAYPEDIFIPVPESKLKDAAKALEAIGVDMGALHAGWARHLLTGLGRILRGATNAR